MNAIIVFVKCFKGVLVVMISIINMCECCWYGKVVPSSVVLEATSDKVLVF